MCVGDRFANLDSSLSKCDVKSQSNAAREIIRTRMSDNQTNKVLNVSHETDQKAASLRKLCWMTYYEGEASSTVSFASLAGCPSSCMNSSTLIVISFSCWIIFLRSKYSRARM